MNNSVFEKGYADQYDSFYWDKNYETECDLIEKIFHNYGEREIKSILDLGCGTGNHSIPLAKRGYCVNGIDISDNMLSHAIEKTKQDKLENTPAFSKGDIRNLKLDIKFDAVIMMFAVLGYQIKNEDVLAALKTVNDHLKPDGLFIMDIWFGPAVLAIRPSQRIKIIPTNDGKIIRTVTGSLDIIHHTSDVNYHIWKLSGDKVIDEIEETHRMRFFFPEELNLFYSFSGLTIKKIAAFPLIDKDVDETTWNAIVIGKR